MKILFRILVILVAAFLVVGATYAIGQTGWAAERAQSTFSHGAPEGSQPPEGAELSEASGRPTQGPEMPEGLEARGGGRTANPLSTASLIAFARTLIPMALVIIVVASATEGINAVRRRTGPATE